MTYPVPKYVILFHMNLMIGYFNNMILTNSLYYKYFNQNIKYSIFL
jgi:hypothetical protein